MIKLDEKNNINENPDLEFNYKENISNVKISFERVAFIFFIFFVIAIIFSAKVIFLSFKSQPEIKKIVKKENYRASILDINGNLIAKTVPVVNIGINPNEVINKEKLLLSLKIIFPDRNFKRQMNGKKFFYVKKKNSSR